MELSNIIMKSFQKRRADKRQEEAMQQPYNIYAAGFRDAMRFFKLLKDE